LQDPGKSYNFLGSDAHGSFWLQIDMFMQTKITIVVATRYIYWAAGTKKCFCGRDLPPTKLEKLRALSQIS